MWDYRFEVLHSPPTEDPEYVRLAMVFELRMLWQIIRGVLSSVLLAYSPLYPAIHWEEVRKEYSRFWSCLGFRFFDATLPIYEVQVNLNLKLVHDHVLASVVENKTSQPAVPVSELR